MQGGWSEVRVALQERGVRGGRSRGAEDSARTRLRGRVRARGGVRGSMGEAEGGGGKEGEEIRGQGRIVGREVRGKPSPCLFALSHTTPPGA